MKHASRSMALLFEALDSILGSLHGRAERKRFRLSVPFFSDRGTMMTDSVSVYRAVSICASKQNRHFRRTVYSSPARHSLAAKICWIWWETSILSRVDADN